MKFKSTHGLSAHPVGKAWYNMHKRCNGGTDKWLKDYKDRGIIVCERWADIKAFYDDMIKTWQPGLSLDRIDVNGNYEPENCRWVTRTTSMKNKRNKCLNQSSLDVVTYHKNNKKWQVKFVFDTKEDAEIFASKALKG